MSKKHAIFCVSFKLLLRKGDRFLFLRLAEEKFKNILDLPGGRADIGEEESTITEILKREGYEAEVIDLRTLAPLDKDTIIKSVAKTGRVVIVEEGTLTGGVGAEISSIITENSFFDLDAPPLRVASLDLPIPYSPKLEEAVLPNTKKVLNAIFKILY